MPNHTHWLPSLNLRFGLTDEQFVRFAASRALARADMGLYKFYYNIAEVEPSCAAGNVTYAVPGDCTTAAGGLHAALHRGRRQSDA